MRGPAKRDSASPPPPPPPPRRSPYNTHLSALSQFPITNYQLPIADSQIFVAPRASYAYLMRPSCVPAETHSRHTFFVLRSLPARRSEVRQHTTGCGCGREGCWDSADSEDLCEHVRDSVAHRISSPRLASPRLASPRHVRYDKS
ncbi:hypothetical protein V9T40_004604 [Parthenolecanium corni]|uniref:Uncharacterized protein n=1 Tax=Parthenolecanium corni TaxID=536013 RepID=A0AAN9TUC6_9HEMI